MGRGRLLGGRPFIYSAPKSKSDFLGLENSISINSLPVCKNNKNFESWKPSCARFLHFGHIKTATTLFQNFPRTPNFSFHFPDSHKFPLSLQPQLTPLQLQAAMKSQLQVLLLLEQYTPASELDRDMITAFVQKRYNITPSTSIFSSLTASSTINVQSFTQWYESGYTASEIAIHDNSLVILGNCTLTEAKIVGKLGNGTLTTISQTVSTANLSKASDNDTERFLKAMTTANLQYNPSTLSLEAKYVPRSGDKVRFLSYDFKIKGIGIVRAVYEDTQEVELYCYFIYPTKTEKEKLGYSMHEKDVVNLYSYIFEPLVEGRKNSFSDEDGISAYRRLKRELEKNGKVWKDKLRIQRVEPINLKQKKGGKYCYIDDKLTVVQTIDKWTPTSQKRYLSGNYFPDHLHAVKMLGKINEMIRDYLASPKWPEVEDE